MNNWIKRSDALPPLREDVLGFNGTMVFTVVLLERKDDQGEYCEFFCNRWGYTANNITHWAPLPKWPEQKERNKDGMD
jgi:hypothetical protein